MVRWHYWLNGHGFGWTLWVGDGQGRLVCFGSRGCKGLDKTEWLNWTEHILSYRFSFCFIWRRSSWICRIYLCFQVSWVLHCSLQKCLLWVEMSYSPTNCTTNFNKSTSQILCHPHWHLLIICLLASKHKTIQVFLSLSLNEQLFLIRCPDHILENSCKSDSQLYRARQHFITTGVVITDSHKPSGWT